MKIGIDARALSGIHAGVARVVTCVMNELKRIDSNNTYYLYSNRDFDFSPKDDRWIKRTSSQLPILPGSLWLQTEGRKLMALDEIDVFWGAAHILPLKLHPRAAKVVTIHDLVWRLYPRTMGGLNGRVHRLYAERSIRQAESIISVSESTARDLQRILKVPESKIEVVHLGVGDAFKPCDPQAAAHFVASKYGISERYILTVGTLEPRKNVVTLIEAVKILRRRGEAGFQLVVVGASGWKNKDLHVKMRQSGLAETDVRFLGFAPEQDLPMLYSGASSFVFPSLYEGFGLPLVEAMACGVPIVASHTSSVPEIVQDAALLVSPERPEAFAEAVLKIWRNDDLRNAMRDKGLRRALHFRWDITARGVLQCLRRAVEAHSGQRRGSQKRSITA